MSFDEEVLDTVACSVVESNQFKENFLKWNPEPLFLTQKYTVRNLNESLEIFDFQLKDHFRSVDDLYVTNCLCRHSHNKNRCALSTSPICLKCENKNQSSTTASEKFISHQAFLYHRDTSRLRLAKCCTHIHYPPCGLCFGCRTIPVDDVEKEKALFSSRCIIKEPFECDLTTEVICKNAYAHNIETGDSVFTKQYGNEADAGMLIEHMYNIKQPLFYLCYRHRHIHRLPALAPDVLRELAKKSICYVQTEKCCSEAIFITDYDKSFVMHVTSLGLTPFLSTLIPATVSSQQNNNSLSFVTTTTSTTKTKKNLKGVTKKIHNNQRVQKRKYVKRKKTNSVKTDWNKQLVSEQKQTQEKEEYSRYKSHNNKNCDNTTQIQNEDNLNFLKQFINHKNECYIKDYIFEQNIRFDDDEINIINIYSNVLTANTASLTAAKKERTISTSSLISSSQCNNLYTYITKTKSPILSSFIIFDPSLWREQSKNHFNSLVRCLIVTISSRGPSSLNNIQKRYQNFANSHFVVSNLANYKSGKQSIVRMGIMGFETFGIYQTATISCELNANIVLIPQILFDKLKETYDLQYVAVKRDPSIKQTCLSICLAVRNPDPDIQTVVISAERAKPMNQDQDGDKNGIYILPLKRKGYDRRESYLHQRAKLELAKAFDSKLTLDATPRLSFSENDLHLMYLHQDEFAKKSIFFRKTYPFGTKYMIENSCGYMAEEYAEFRSLLQNVISSTKQIIGVDELIQIDEKQILKSIVLSGSKGSPETLQLTENNISANCHLSKKKFEMLEQMKRYIDSSQELSHTGREHFSSQYAAHDLIICNGLCKTNGVPVCFLNECGFCYPMLWSQGSLEAFTKDLIDNYEQHVNNIK